MKQDMRSNLKNELYTEPADKIKINEGKTDVRDRDADYGSA
jgi:hypothetical protein